MKYIQKYKCRMCGEMIEGGITGNEAIVMSDMARAIAFLPPKRPMGATINGVHACKNGSCGVTDFIGYEKKEETDNEKDKTQNDLKKIAQYHGLKCQLMQTTEECGELIQAIGKVFRCDTICAGSKQYNAVAEEIADVEIMLEQIKMLLDCSSVVEMEKQAKIKRELERIAQND